MENLTEQLNYLPWPDELSNIYHGICKRNSYLPMQLHPIGLLGVLWDVGLWEVESEAQALQGAKWKRKLIYIFCLQKKYVCTLFEI